jgi:hypothetical protein
MELSAVSPADNYLFSMYIAESRKLMLDSANPKGYSMGEHLITINLKGG